MLESGSGFGLGFVLDSSLDFRLEVRVMVIRVSSYCVVFASWF